MADYTITAEIKLKDLASENIKKIGKTIEEIKPNFTALGVALGGLSASMGLVANSALRVASQFDTAMKEISTITEANTAIISTEILDMSRIVPQSAKELAKGLYEIISAAIPVEKSMGVLDVSARAAVAGLTDAATAVDVLTTILNAYGFEAEKAEHLSDILFRAVERGKMRFEDLAVSIGQVATPAAVAGVSFEEVSAAIATMTRKGLDTASATVYLRQVIMAILGPTAEAEKRARELGLEFTSAALRAKGLSGFLADVAEKTRMSNEDLTTLFGNVRAFTGVLTIAGEGADDFAEDLELMGSAAGSTQKAFEKMMTSHANVMRVMRNQWDAFQIQMTELFLPTLTLAVKEFGKLIESMSKFVESNKEITKVLVVSTTALIGFTTAIVALKFAIPAIIGAFKAFIVLWTVSIPVAIGKTLATIKLFLATPWGIALVGLGAVGLAIKSIAKETDDLIDKHREQVDSINNLIKQYNDLDTAITDPTEKMVQQKSIISQIIEILPEYRDELEKMAEDGKLTREEIEKINKELARQYNIQAANRTALAKVVDTWIDGTAVIGKCIFLIGKVITTDFLKWIEEAGDDISIIFEIAYLKINKAYEWIKTKLTGDKEKITAITEKYRKKQDEIEEKYVKKSLDRSLKYTETLKKFEVERAKLREEWRKKGEMPPLEELIKPKVEPPPPPPPPPPPDKDKDREEKRKKEEEERIEREKKLSVEKYKILKEELEHRLTIMEITKKDYDGRLLSEEELLEKRKSALLLFKENLELLPDLVDQNRERMRIDEEIAKIEVNLGILRGRQAKEELDHRITMMEITRRDYEGRILSEEEILERKRNALLLSKENLELIPDLTERNKERMRIDEEIAKIETELTNLREKQADKIIPDIIIQEQERLKTIERQIITEKELIANWERQYKQGRITKELLIHNLKIIINMVEKTEDRWRIEDRIIDLLSTGSTQFEKQYESLSDRVDMAKMEEIPILLKELDILLAQAEAEGVRKEIVKDILKMREKLAEELPPTREERIRELKIETVALDEQAIYDFEIAWHTAVVNMKRSATDLADVMTTALQGITDALAASFEAIMTENASARNAFKTAWKEAREDIKKSVADMLADMTRDIIHSFLHIDTLMAKSSAALRYIGETAKTIGGEALSFLENASKSIWNGIEVVSSHIWNIIREKGSAAFNAIASVAKTVWNTIWSIASTVLKAIIAELLKIEAIQKAIAAIKAVGRALLLFQTAPGEMKVIPGSPAQEIPIIAHGGEIIGRPKMFSIKDIITNLSEVITSDVIKQIFRPVSYQTRAGEFKTVIGPPNVPQIILAHGGEIIGRPKVEAVTPTPTTNVVVNIHPGIMFGGDEALLTEAIKKVFTEHDLLANKGLTSEYLRKI